MNPICQTLDQWAEAGWLRRLDAALAAFLSERDLDASPPLLVAAAVLSQMEGRGHTCLPLAHVVAPPLALLAGPPEAQAAVHALWSTLPTTLVEWVAALRASRVVRDARLDDDNGQPLVLGGKEAAPVLYLRRYWDYECRVARQLRQRVSDRVPVDEAVTRTWLDQLFPTAVCQEAKDAHRGDTFVTDWQKLACAVALRARLSVITGGPGTGKTYTAARLLALLFAVDADAQGLRVALAAPTGKAAARLKQSIDASLAQLQDALGDRINLSELTQRVGAARTLHALLGARPDTRQFRHNASHPLDVDVLIVDEASMIHLEMMAALLDALPPTARVIFLGDKDQLASVEAGAVLGDLCRDAERGCYEPETLRYAREVAGQDLDLIYQDHSGAAPLLAQQTVMLRESRRFGGPIGKLALAVNQGDVRASLSILSQDKTGAVVSLAASGPEVAVQLALQGRAHAEGGYAEYLQAMATRPDFGDETAHTEWVRRVLTAFDRFRLLCAVREGDWGVTGLNRVVQQALACAGWVKPSGEWFEGRPVMVTRNDPTLGVFNGDIGIALRPVTRGAPLRAYFMDGPEIRSVGVSRLAHVETAFAMTVHKSQGSEFRHTALVLPPYGLGMLQRELVYTGITRAREAFTLVAADPGALTSAIQHPTQRASGLLTLLADD
ncbi:exodeoxyribonuclease V subunit alpha [Aquabacterium sp. G14]|uniref:exodeoxyribonuclease V subunit alpha n=1 Tax=Aquabacterium sp. G14 TaxID=3130164 RepID=UPI0030AA7393